MDEHSQDALNPKHTPVLVCQGCRLTPPEIQEYVEAAADAQTTPTLYVWREEGTLNRANGHFLCTDCYIDAGMPSSPRGWVCP